MLADAFRQSIAEMGLQICFEFHQFLALPVYEKGLIGHEKWNN